MGRASNLLLKSLVPLLFKNTLLLFFLSIFILDFFDKLEIVLPKINFGNLNISCCSYEGFGVVIKNVK
ncbi:hypothetical protein C2G38_2188907 [Gigaspora rosea]|uniref:Uncharacterized protein n=1 Tax=Gigaspora rosea TaxID=44941 RepID=A0A397VA17_9GLOM|nr:hypothetical protein C2G38_2188907 [Gigaspora rosea]